MDKLKLTGRTLGRVFNSRRVCMHAMHLLSSVAIQPNLELKTQPKQLLGYLPLDIALPIIVYYSFQFKLFSLITKFQPPKGNQKLTGYKEFDRKRKIWFPSRDFGSS
jgi:hypothetical protein